VLCQPSDHCVLDYDGGAHTYSGEVQGSWSTQLRIESKTGSLILDVCPFLTYSCNMQTVIETELFLRDAKSVGLSDEERDVIVNFVASNPDAGNEIRGTGGARKLRFAGKGKGKSGGYRVITFYGGDDIPVFLLNVFAKNEKTDLSQAERNELKTVLTALADTYRRRRN